MARSTELPHEVRYTRRDAILSAIGATLLIVTEMLGAVVAFAWAIGGLIGFSETTLIIFVVVLMVPGLYLALTVTRRILRVEHALNELPLS